MRSLCKSTFTIMIIVAFACKPSHHTHSKIEPSGLPSIDGKWTLIELNGKKIDDSEFQQERPWLEFKSTENKVGGTTGCNRLGATFTTTENKLEIGVVAATRMACPGDLEDRFLKAMDLVTEFKTENLTLYLMDEENVKMLFRRTN